METLKEYLDRQKKDGQILFIDVSLIPTEVSIDQFIKITELLFENIKIPKCD